MKQSFFDNPKSTRIIIRSLIAICAFLFLLDAFIHRHTTHPWEEMFGFYAIYGFVACVLLVVIAKELRILLMRSESYYTKKEKIENNNELDITDKQRKQGDKKDE